MKDSLKKKTLVYSVIPFIIVELIALIICVFTFRRIMKEDVNKDMHLASELVIDVYDRIYPGKFDIDIDTDTGKYTVLKGGEDITDTTDILEDLSRSCDAEISIFCRNIRVITTLDKAFGIETTGQKCADRVKTRVLDEKKTVFYDNAKILSHEIYAYYAPIILDDGTVYGMVGIARPSEAVKKTLFRSIIPLIIFWTISAVFIGIIMVYFTNKNVIKRIEIVQTFLKKVSTGDFSADVGEYILSGNDEISDLAQSGQKMKKAMRLLVEYDELTRIYNRRAANKRLKEINLNDRNRRKPYCVGICDIDFFKKVNDTYGHDNGDATLKKVAEILKKVMDKFGFVARWGGEEFLVLFDGYTLEESAKVLNKIRERIEDTVIKGRGQEIRVTISSGITEALTGENLDDIVKRADDCLYYSKENGRNQVTARRKSDML